jgi:hypothetical protein
MRGIISAGRGEEALGAEEAELDRTGEEAEFRQIILTGLILERAGH